MRVKSKGCPSCIATVLLHLYRIPGVKGARVRGSSVLVLIEDESTAKRILSSDAIRDYYVVEEWSIVEGNLLKETLEFKLKG